MIEALAWPLVAALGLVLGAHFAHRTGLAQKDKQAIQNQHAALAKEVQELSNRVTAINNRVGR